MIDAASAANLLYSAGNTSALANVAGLGDTKKLNDAQINRTSQDFESMFLAQMLEQMFGDSLGTEAFGDEETNQIYKGLMVDEYGKMITKTGGIGIADYVKRELLRLQEK